MNIKIENVLALKIKDRYREGEILCQCPKCGCSDCNMNIILGIGQCWHCSERFSIIGISGKDTLTPKIKKDVSKIRTFFNEITNIYQSRLPDHLTDYLIDRGLTEETIKKYRLGYCSTDEWLDQYDLPIAAESGLIRSYHLILGNRITIPYIYKGVVVDIRGRIAPEFQNENTPNYMSLYGSYEDRGAVYLYNHDVIKNSPVIIITEGEFKALAAMQYGLPIVATPGIHRWIDEWSQELKGKRIILAYDNELKINPPALTQARAMKKIFPDAKVAVLEKPLDKKKIDIDEFLKTRGIDDFKDILRGAIPIDKYITMQASKRFITK